MSACCGEARGPAFTKTEFATDSPLEQAGFELSVPAAVRFVKTRYHPVAREYRRRPLHPARREKIAPGWQGLALARSSKSSCGSAGPGLLRHPPTLTNDIGGRALFE
jgi:hypothetical protein